MLMKHLLGWSGPYSSGNAARNQNPDSGTLLQKPPPLGADTSTLLQKRHLLATPRCVMSRTRHMSAPDLKPVLSCCFKNTDTHTRTDAHTHAPLKKTNFRGTVTSYRHEHVHVVRIMDRMHGHGHTCLPKLCDLACMHTHTHVRTSRNT